MNDKQKEFNTLDIKVREKRQYLNTLEENIKRAEKGKETLENELGLVTKNLSDFRIQLKNVTDSLAIQVKESKELRSNIEHEKAELLKYKDSLDLQAKFNEIELKTLMASRDEFNKQKLEVKNLKSDNAEEANDITRRLKEIEKAKKDVQMRFIMIDDQWREIRRAKDAFKDSEGVLNFKDKQVALITIDLENRASKQTENELLINNKLNEINALNSKLKSDAEALEKSKEDILSREKEVEAQKESYNRNILDLKNLENTLKIKELRLNKILKDKAVERELRTLEAQQKKG